MWEALFGPAARHVVQADPKARIKWAGRALAALVTVGGALFSSGAAHAQATCNIATNGSFETPNLQTTTQSPGENTAYQNGYAIWRTSTLPIDGWQIVAGTVDRLRHFNNASDGAQSIDLWGTAAATIRQTFTGLVPGQQYTFSIDYSGLSATNSTASVQLGNGVGATPVTIATLTAAATAVSNGNAGLPTTPQYTVTWRTFSHTFAAVDTEVTVQFVNQAAPATINTGLFIDNFVFTSISPCEVDLSITKDDGLSAYVPGDTTSYAIVVSNNGPGPVGQARVSDLLPTGVTSATWTCGGETNGGVCAAPSGTGAISTTANLPAGASVTYMLNVTTAANRAGPLTNTATVSLPLGMADLDESNNSATDIDLAPEPEVSIAKTALLRSVRRGEEAPFLITVTNLVRTWASDLRVTDTLPAGFRFVEGSATVDGVAVTPVVEGSRVIFEDVDIAGNSRVEIRLRMLALSSAAPGRHVNRASVSDASGGPLAEATASIEIPVDPVFDCGDVIGRVFDDGNRSGYQDEGELGLPGVRVATVDAWLITTDAHGRFHVPCAALPDQRLGSNFIMKLDSRTLPTGYRLTTENPRVVRLTAGKMTELNFGAAIGRVVRLDLQDVAFEPGTLELLPEWARGIEQLLAVLGKEQSVLRLTYVDASGDPELANQRLKHLSGLIEARWREARGQYRLEIEMRVETGR